MQMLPVKPKIPPTELYLVLVSNVVDGSVAKGVPEDPPEFGMLTLIFEGQILSKK